MSASSHPLPLVRTFDLAQKPSFETHGVENTLGQLKESTSVTVHPGEDGFFRLHFRFADKKQAELAYYNNAPEHEDFPHVVSTSTQIGCAYSCNHCDAEGFIRNLSSEEMLFMIDTALAHAGANDGQPIKVIGLGMGDPGANASEIIGFLAPLKDRWPTTNYFLASTAGAIAGVKKFAAAKDSVIPIHLQISLHGATHEQRKQVVPVPDLPLERLLDAGRLYFAETRRPAIVNYMVVDGFNNTNADAGRLQMLLQPAEAFTLKLVRANPIEKSPAWMTQATDAQIQAFAAALADHGAQFNIITPVDSGIKVGGACGQQRIQDHGNTYAALKV